MRKEAKRNTRRLKKLPCIEELDGLNKVKYSHVGEHFTQVKGKIRVLIYLNLKRGKHLESEAEARYMQIRNKALVCNIVNI